MRKCLIINNLPPPPPFRKNLNKGSVFIFAIILLLFACSKNDENPPIKAEDLKFEVVFDKSLKKTFYPSLILSFSKLAKESKEGMEFLNYKITSPEDNAVLKIKLKASALNEETLFQTTLGKKGTQKEFTPKISWDYNKLKCLNQPGSANLHFAIYINDKEITTKSIAIDYRSVNECVYGIVSPDGTKFVNLSFMFAAYVNEDHPKVDVFLSEVLAAARGKIATSAFNGFIGYQGGAQKVINQVFAIWYYLQTKGMKYSSITATSNDATKVFTQNVRTFEQVYNNTQANCVDGSVFLASVLMKIGIEPFLVLVPGHMYLGYHTKPNQSSIILEGADANAELLETTMIGDYSGNDPATSFIQFGLSSGFKTVSFNNNISKFNDANNHQYIIFDVKALRKAIAPIPSCK